MVPSFETPSLSGLVMRTFIPISSVDIVPPSLLCRVSLSACVLTHPKRYTSIGKNRRARRILALSEFVRLHRLGMHPCPRGYQLFIAPALDPVRLGQFELHQVVVVLVAADIGHIQYLRVVGLALQSDLAFVANQPATALVSWLAGMLLTPRSFVLFTARLTQSNAGANATNMLC